MRDYLQGEPAHDAVKARAGLSACGEWLHFREYYTVDKIRLHAASFCKQHLICPLCAIRRGAKALAAYLARYEVIRAERPDLSPYLVTLTVKNGPDLAERFQHLHESLRLLLARRRRFDAGSRGAPWTELCLAEGAVYTFEVTNKGNGW
ncbi:protein rep, partial [Pseudomonas aeruginosa]|uniref:protein rep n=1 Tax=Pseudomonas aeruginosa TaxID=287 RepID=UPI00223168DC